MKKYPTVDNLTELYKLSTEFRLHPLAHSMKLFEEIYGKTSIDKVIAVVRDETDKITHKLIITKYGSVVILSKLKKTMLDYDYKNY